MVDTGTVVAIVVSVVGLGLVLWLRSRMSTGGAVRPVPAPAWRATGSDALDARAAALGALIREADARIAELTALRDELSELRAGPDRSTEPYVGDAFAPRRSVSAARPGVVGGGRAGGLVCSDPVADRVYELADSGRSPVEIAGALQEHTGKVELILALRRSATAARV